MTQLLIEPARRTGCEDLAALGEVLRSAAQRQCSPIDDVLDAGVVDEERYMRELAHDLGMEWLDVIPVAEVPLPLREACGPVSELERWNEGGTTYVRAAAGGLHWLLRGADVR